MPAEIDHLSTQLQSLHGALVGLVGFQGVGKSSALLALSAGLRQRKTDESPCVETMLFKWHRSADLFKSLFEYNHEASLQFLSAYKRRMKPSRPTSIQQQGSDILSNKLSRLEQQLRVLDEGFLKDLPWAVSVDEEEKQLGRTKTARLRRIAWLDLLRSMHTIFVDMPDYSKTDRRLMAKDLEEIYWLWNSLSRTDGALRPNLVIAIQKEMFRGHFFLDKIQKVELLPMQPEAMIEAYNRRFRTSEPFSHDALLGLACMSRGVFRRFLRHITLTLDAWETDRATKNQLIDVAAVNDAVTTDRLGEDMELELTEIFPKHSDLRLRAVRLLMYLEESGPTRQSTLTEELGMEEYALSRLLAKLELHRYIVRRRDGADKLVSLLRI